MEFEFYDKIPMQYLIFDAVPDLTVDHEEGYAGASVGCWIKDQTPKNAYLIARGLIQDHGWVVLGLDEQYRITAEDYDDKPEGKEFFEQALLDNEVFVFHTYMTGEE